MKKFFLILFIGISAQINADFCEHITPKHVPSGKFTDEQKCTTVDKPCTKKKHGVKYTYPCKKQKCGVSYDYPCTKHKTVHYGPSWDRKSKKVPYTGTCSGTKCIDVPSTCTGTHTIDVPSTCPTKVCIPYKKPVMEDSAPYKKCKADAAKLAKSGITKDIANAVKAGAHEMSEAAKHVTAPAAKAINTIAQAGSDARNKLTSEASKIASSAGVSVPKIPSPPTLDNLKALGANILKDFKAAVQGVTECSCAFLDWTNEKDLLTLENAEFQTYLAPSYKAGQNKTDFCKKKKPNGYDLVFVATQKDLQQVFTKKVGPTLQKSQEQINTGFGSLVTARKKLNTAQASLNTSQKEFDAKKADAMKSFDDTLAEIDTKTKEVDDALKGKSIVQVRSLLTQLNPKDKAEIATLGYKVFPPVQLTALTTSTQQTIQLLIAFGELTAVQGKQIVTAIGTVNELAIATGKLKAARTKVENEKTIVAAQFAVAQQKLTKAEPTITKGQEAVTHALATLKTSQKQVSEYQHILQKVLGIDIKLVTPSMQLATPAASTVTPPLRHPRINRPNLRRQLGGIGIGPRLRM